MDCIESRGASAWREEKGNFNSGKLLLSEAWEYSVASAASFVKMDIRKLGTSVNNRQIFFGMLLGAQALVSHGQNLLTNGSFETANPFVQTLSVGSTNLMGWSIGGTGTIFTVTIQALDGGRSISFNHNTVTLSQSFETTAGNDYDVAFTVGY